MGYVRVSSFDQNPERQLEQTQVSKVFTDKASGKDTQRPQLEALLSFVREGDTVVVHSMDRLARNLDDLRRLVQKLTQRGVRIEFLKEGLVFTGEDSPMANLMLSVMGAFAEFERDVTRREHAQELRTYLQLAPFGLSDFRALVRELTELAQQTDKGLLLAGQALE
ncbi:TPA: recombinase family protein, partial [Escherichia coli]|nr:recombinase family protein [Escherichia coli]